MKKINKFFIIIFIAILLVIILSFIDKDLININNIRELILNAGIFAPIIYIIAFSLVPLTFFPDSLLAILGGSLFGLYQGSIFTIIGALIGGSISFFLSRLLGNRFIKPSKNKKLLNIEEILKNQGFLTILILRLIPLFPFDLISYGAGLTSIKYNDFFFGTLIGTIPGIIVFVNLGAQWISLDKTSIYCSISILILFILFSLILKKSYLKKQKD